MSSFRVSGILSLDGSRFSAGLSRAEIAASRFARNVSSSIGARLAGIFSVGALGLFAKKTIDTADALVVAARRMSLSVEQVQVLKVAAKESGVELSRMTQAFDLLTVAQNKALGGGAIGDALRARFARVGISDAQLRTMTGAQLAMGPMAAWAKTVSQQDAVALLKPMLGRAAGGIVDFLRADLSEVEAQLKKFGGLMSTETAVSLKVLKDASEVAGQILIGRFAPALVDSIEWLARFGVAIGKVVSQAIGGVGAGTANMTTWQKMTAYPRILFSAMAGINAGAMGRGNEGMVEAFSQAMGKSGFDLEGAATAIDDAGKEWDEILGNIDKLKDWIEQEAFRILHPIAPSGAGVVPAVQKFAKPESDAMLAIGGFLGAGRTSSIQRIAEQHLRVAENTLAAIEDIRDSVMEEGGFF